MIKVYIAGAITDNPNYREQFKAAEERLTALGYAVINPCKNEGFTYREYINMGLCELMHCDAIYLLKGYEKSTGATLEHDYARTVGLKVMSEAAEETAEALKKLGEAAAKFRYEYGKTLRIKSPAYRTGNYLLEQVTMAERLGVGVGIGKDDVAKVKKLLEKDKPRAIVAYFSTTMCPNCGSDVNEYDEYCSQCGQHLR